MELRTASGSKDHKNFLEPQIRTLVVSRVCWSCPERLLLYLILFLPGLPGRQHQDHDGRLPLPGRQQLRRDPVDPPLRQPCQKHQEQAQDQRGPEGRHAERVPERDTEAQGYAGQAARGVGLW